jgi:hypothetical protein
MCLKAVFVDVLDHGRERCRLPTAGGARDEDHAALLLGQPADDVRESEIAERANRVRNHPEDDRHGTALEVAVDAEARHVRHRVGAGRPASALMGTYRVSDWSCPADKGVLYLTAHVVLCTRRAS